MIYKAINSDPCKYYSNKHLHLTRSPVLSPYSIIKIVNSNVWHASNCMFITEMIIDNENVNFINAYINIFVDTNMYLELYVYILYFIT